MPRRFTLLRMILAVLALIWLATPASAVAVCGGQSACESTDPDCNHDRSPMSCPVACKPACSIAIFGAPADLSINPSDMPSYYSPGLKFLVSTSSGLDPPPPRS
jgi:hypothetical protein